MTHYLYFADRNDADEASAVLAERNFAVEVRLGADGTHWLLLVTHSLASWRGNRTVPSEYFQAIATHFGAEYDGWEIGPDTEAA